MVRPKDWRPLAPVAHRETVLLDEAAGKALLAAAGRVRELADAEHGHLGRERLGIVGESGSGKSQTGRAILGLTAPESLAAAGGMILVADGAGHRVAAFRVRSRRPRWPARPRRSARGPRRARPARCGRRPGARGAGPGHGFVLRCCAARPPAPGSAAAPG